MKLKDKVVVITGASDGIGRQIALRLAKECTKLALIARNEERLRNTVDEATSFGASEAKFYSCDLRNTEKLESVANKIISDFGHVDILINNAGVWQKLMSVMIFPKRLWMRL